MTHQIFILILGYASGGFKHVLTDKRGDKQNIGIITLNRPKALNSLCVELQEELSEAIRKMDNDESIAAIVLTGGDKVFAAGKLLFYFTCISCNN